MTNTFISRFVTRKARGKSWLALTAWLAFAVALVSSLNEKPPRVHNLADLPIAFWHWQTATPAPEEIEIAIKEARLQTLFLRTGQLDFEGGKLRRIRPVNGAMPRAITLHFVYNATRDFLQEFAALSIDELTDLILASFAEDGERARQDGGQVVGLQLDIDAPTRLLTHYAKLLARLRQRLPAEINLSITGLPTWMEAAALRRVLEPLDFWTPQFYGAQVPNRLDQPIPISSPQWVAQQVAQARRLGKPFYAGLAAYGYAILYSNNGRLVAVRGDLDPARVVRDANFERLERKPFRQNPEPEAVTAEWRYVYLARNDGIIDNLAVRAGDHLLLDVQTAHSLRENARMVCQQAGEKLLGLCLFRLPTTKDATTLTIQEIATALADQESVFAVDAQARCQPIAGKPFYRLTLALTNSGSTNSQFGADAMAVKLQLPDTLVRNLSLAGLDRYQSVYQAQPRYNLPSEQPASLRYANLFLFTATAWQPQARARIIFELAKKPPANLSLTLRVLSDDGRERQTELAIPVESEPL